MTTEMPALMLYAILCYHDEDFVGSWTKEQDAAVMKKLSVVHDKLAKQGRLGPVARLLPTTAATTLRKDDPPLVLDGPFAETKEQLLGFYLVDCKNLDERLDGSHYRDDILRLLFICCHPDLPATQQIALALRIVSGLTVKQIARAFLVSEAAMEQRITRAKARVADADVPFETPGAVERSERLTSVAAMIYLIFNEGYSASGDTAEIRSTLCEEAIRLARLLLRLFQSEPEIMGLTALLLLQHARAAARFDADGALILLEDQDRSLWNQKMIAEGLALIDKAMRHRRSGPYQIQAAIAALHARAAKPDETDWTQIDLLYGALEIMQPSPVVTLNRAVAVSKVKGPQAALEMIEPLAARLSNYFNFYGVRGAFLMQLGRNDEARVAFDRAIALANTSAEAAHIRMHLDRLMRDCQPRGLKAK